MDELSTRARSFRWFDLPFLHDVVSVVPLHIGVASRVGDLLADRDSMLALDLHHVSISIAICDLLSRDLHARASPRRVGVDRGGRVQSSISSIRLRSRLHICCLLVDCKGESKVNCKMRLAGGLCPVFVWSTGTLIAALCKSHRESLALTMCLRVLRQLP